MKTSIAVWCSVCAAAVAGHGQSNLAISSFHGNGVLTWTYPTNVGSTRYRVEWASQAAGPWCSFSNAAARLDSIVPTGAVMSAAVPMLYRVVAAEPTVSAAWLLVDDYEGLGQDADITDVFRTPTVGPTNSTAWYEGHGGSQAKSALHLDGLCAKVYVPSNAALDYISHLGTPCGGAPFLLTWDMEADAVDGGGGMFFVRFSRADDNGMQVLFGFLDDGRIIRFFDEPSNETYVEVGTFQAGVRYRTYFIYDLAKAEFSVLFDGKWIVDHAAVPALFKMDGITQFGFDVNQTLGLPDQPALGNAYWIDNVRFGPLNGPH